MGLPPPSTIFMIIETLDKRLCELRYETIFTHINDNPETPVAVNSIVTKSQTAIQGVRINSRLILRLN